MVHCDRFSFPVSLGVQELCHQGCFFPERLHGTCYGNHCSTLSMCGAWSLCLSISIVYSLFVDVVFTLCILRNCMDIHWFLRSGVAIFDYSPETIMNYIYVVRSSNLGVLFYPNEYVQISSRFIILADHHESLHRKGRRKFCAFFVWCTRRSRFCPDTFFEFELFSKSALQSAYHLRAILG